MEKDLIDLTKEELIDSGFIPSIYENYPNESERNEILNSILVVAKGKGATRAVKNAIAKCNKEMSIQKMDDNLVLILKTDSNGNAESSVDNYEQAILNIKDFKGKIKYNEFTGKLERVLDDGRVKTWDDYDDAWAMQVIERQCNIYDVRKYTQGLMTCVGALSYHPIKDLIESAPWDGISRIDKFLTNIMDCQPDEDIEDDESYYREVSRMIFYGGINRLYNPGCKFDYMPVLIGEQGTGKSTLVNWLSMDTGYYREVLTIEGSEGAEILGGAWICEFSELLAMVSTKYVENMKAFVTRQVDSYRRPYARHSADYPRHCIFIGTTNTYEFLTDGTGNRRYLPIEVKTTHGELFEREKEVKDYILQCWREAKFLYDHKKAYLTIPDKYYNLLEIHRNMATQDDPDFGIIMGYLDEKQVGDKVCALDIYTNCLGGLRKNYNSKKDGRYIAEVMQKFKGWRRSKTNATFENFGKQRYWTKLR